MKSIALSLGIVSILYGATLAAEFKRDDATHPIIAQLLSDPGVYSKKEVTIYGLVIERVSDSVFFLQDVSQRPLKVMGTRGVKAAVGDQIIVRGTLAKDRDGAYFLARAITSTCVLGGGGCC
jgi:hypothetical protein